MAVQDALYSLEVGQGRRWVQVGAIFVGFVFLSLLYFLMAFRGFYHVGAMDTAQLARQMATGKGYTTLLIRPAALRQFTDYYESPAMAQKSPQPKIDVFALPDISIAPVYPAVLSAIFRVTRVSFDPTPAELAKSQTYAPERWIVIFNQICLFLTALVLFFWSWRMFDDRVAFVATVAFVGCDLVWQFALTGLSTIWVMLLVTTMGAMVHEALIAEEEDRRLAVWSWSLGSAVVMVLIILSRLSFAWLILPYAAVMLVSLRRLVLPPLAALLIVFLGITPWYVRNYKVCGNPFGTGLSLVADSGSADDALGERTFDAGKGMPVKRALYKSFIGLGYGINNFFLLEGSSMAVLLFVTALLHRFKRQRTQFMRWFWVGCGLVIIVGGSLVRPDPKPLEEGNNIIIFMPGFATIGAAFFYVLLDRMDVGLQILRYIVVTLFLIVCSMPMVMTLLHPGVSNFRYPPYFPPMIRYITQLVQPDEMMMSDIPAATAWYGNRASLWFPATLKEFYEINDTVELAHGLLLTPMSWDSSLYQIDKGPSSDWAPIVRRQGVPNGFPLNAYVAMPPLENEYLFFSDHKRW